MAPGQTSHSSRLLEGSNSLVQRSANHSSLLLGNALHIGWNLGNESLGQGIRSGLLLHQVLESSSRCASLLDDGLLGDEVSDGGLCDGGEGLSRLLERKSVGQGKGLGGGNLCCCICEGLVDHHGHAEDFHCIGWALDGFDGSIESSKGSTDGSDAGLNGLQVTLGDWGGEGCTEEGEGDDGGVEHDCGLKRGDFSWSRIGNANGMELKLWIRNPLRKLVQVLYFPGRLKGPTDVIHMCSFLMLGRS